MLLLDAIFNQTKMSLVGTQHLLRSCLFREVPEGSQTTQDIFIPFGFLPELHNKAWFIKMQNTSIARYREISWNWHESSLIIASFYSVTDYVGKKNINDRHSFKLYGLSSYPARKNMPIGVIVTKSVSGGNQQTWD